jgi:hypothetical protein
VGNEEISGGFLSLRNPPYDGTNGSLRNPPFTEGIGDGSGSGFAKDLAAKLNLYQSNVSV